MSEWLILKSLRFMIKDSKIQLFYSLSLDFILAALTCPRSLMHGEFLLMSFFKLKFLTTECFGLSWSHIKSIYLLLFLYIKVSHRLTMVLSLMFLNVCPRQLDPLLTTKLRFQNQYAFT